MSESKPGQFQEPIVRARVRQRDGLLDALVGIPARKNERQGRAQRLDHEEVRDSVTYSF